MYWFFECYAFLHYKPQIFISSVFQHSSSPRQGVDTAASSITENVTLSDGKTVVPINGSTQPTLDIRAGTTAFGTPGIQGSTTGFSATPTTSSTGSSADMIY